ncbi:MAG: rhodanese-like domain-containing protein [Bacteroidota bacterium]|jgi:rhodanese-related sulfurtransferase
MKTINYETLKPRLDAGEDIKLIDVREPAEHAEYNIGGTLLPLGKVQTMQIEDIEDFRNDEVVVYCRSGRRSLNAVLVLEQLGFTNVANLEGGMLEWQEKAGK